MHLCHCFCLTLLCIRVRHLLRTLSRHCCLPQAAETRVRGGNGVRCLPACLQTCVGAQCCCARLRACLGSQHPTLWGMWDAALPHCSSCSVPHPPVPRTPPHRRRRTRGRNLRRRGSRGVGAVRVCIGMRCGMPTVPHTRDPGGEGRGGGGGGGALPPGQHLPSCGRPGSGNTPPLNPPGVRTWPPQPQPPSLDDWTMASSASPERPVDQPPPPPHSCLSSSPGSISH